MKAHYFDQLHADRDDILLQSFVKSGVVPQYCLLGGDLVQMHVDEGKDPCESCPGPRVRCRGRPRKLAEGEALEHDEVSAKIYSEKQEVVQRRQLMKAQAARKLLEEAFKE